MSRAALAALVLAMMTVLPATPVHADQVRSDQWHLRYLKVVEAHKIAQGEGIVIALPDTGVDPHPDLQANLLSGTEIVSSQGDGRKNRDSHGTEMAGLIAAHGRGAGIGALGIAPASKVLPITATHSDRQGTADDLAAGIEYALNRGADIISISSVGGSSIRLEQAIKAALDANVVIVAAAGNQPHDFVVGYPARLQNVIAVGGVDREGKHAAISVTGREIDVAAPAVDIYSTSYDGKYAKGSGTSSATAIVAGAVALIRAKYPDLSAQEVAHRLTATAVDKGPPGRDDEYGYGVIDLVAALTADVPPLVVESPTAGAPADATPSTAAAGPEEGAGGTGRWVLTTAGLAAVGGGAAWLLAARRRRRQGAAAAKTDG